MKTVLSLLLFSISTFAAKKNYFAANLKIGTEIEILKDIEFPGHTTLVRLQNGKVLNGKDSTNKLKYMKSYCNIRVDQTDYNYELALANPILKGEKYKVANSLEDNMSRGSTSWSLKSENGRYLLLDCQKSQPLLNQFSESVGISHILWHDNLFPLKIKNVKRTLQGLIIIKD